MCMRAETEGENTNRKYHRENLFKFTSKPLPANLLKLCSTLINGGNYSEKPHSMALPGETLAWKQTETHLTLLSC